MGFYQEVVDCGSCFHYFYVAVSFAMTRVWGALRPWPGLRMGPLILLEDFRSPAPR